MYSIPDAIYCAKFVHTLHRLDTPFFSTLQYYNKVEYPSMHGNTEVSYVLSLIQVIKDVTLSLFCCTEGEAARFGTADYFLLRVCDADCCYPKAYF